MIIGLLSDVARQKSVLPAALVRAVEALRQFDLTSMAPGRHPLEGDGLFFEIQEACSRQLKDSLAEAHRQHADVHIPLSAGERFGFALPQADLPVLDDRLAERDIAFYAQPDNEFFMDLEPGSFVVFLPGELHRPCIARGENAGFRKVVVKIHAQLLGL